ncbi:MAG: reverse transcriptase N-terminal domain-containing protein [Pseudomonadota bacterium]
MKAIEKTVGPKSNHAPADWESIDWELVQRNVTDMQNRIAKAAQEGRWRKMKSLQRSLMRSFSAKALAVKLVTEEQCGQSAGPDGVVWNTPEKKFAAIATLANWREA